MQYAILMHESDDDVGVAVMDLEPGAEVGAATLEGEPVGAVKIANSVPLGHKVAIKALEIGKQIVEYGQPIGYATQAIEAGGHVHVHNLKSLRW